MPTTICPRCGETIPVVGLTDVAWAAIVRTLQGQSPRLAAAELVSLGLADQADAGACIGHLENCVFSWPLAPPLDAIIARIDAAFAGAPRPPRFTNRDHCEECREHDDTLRGRSLHTIRRSDLGNIGWDPINFASPAGTAYYFPALARLAVLPFAHRGRDHFANQLLFKLSHHGRGNAVLAHCDRAQREAVADLIAWLAVSDELAGSMYSDTGWRSLADGAVIWRGG